ncbi:hypothetical protein [Teredinibacter purpureus]|uniref:hypothetical protein n=1 Tax=Teredinibacter purpureus TaxID=2731756 RepID=UPI0005F895E9|nr:hypothetical protein [Teredinibacter purpureus]
MSDDTLPERASTVITISQNTCNEDIQAAFDFAVTAKIFDQPLRLYVISTLPIRYDIAFQQKITSASITLTENFGENIVEYVSGKSPLVERSRFHSILREAEQVIHF